MPEWVGQIGGWIGLVVFVGAVVIYLRGSKDKGTITTLEASNKALTERVDILEASEKRLTAAAEAQQVSHKAEMDAMHVRIETLERENERLLLQRPSADAIEGLHQKLEKHDSDLKTYGREIKKLLEQVAAEVKT